MSLRNTIYALSNVNAILGSTTSYLDAKQFGASTGEAMSYAGSNLTYGALGNAMAYDIQRRTGSYMGYALKSAGGYNNLLTNYQTTNMNFRTLMFTDYMQHAMCPPYVFPPQPMCGPFRMPFGFCC